MAGTKPTSTQIRFNSKHTGEHILDTYLEAAEKGGRPLHELLDDIFDPDSGQLIADIEFRFNTGTYYLQYRHGVFTDPETGWRDVADFRFMVNRGEFAPSTGYNRYDVITLNNSWLICTVPHTSGIDITLANWHYLFDATYIQTTHADIVTRQADITAKHTDIEADHADIETRHADILAIQTDVTDKQTDITDKQTDVTAKYTEINLDHADIQSIQADVTAIQTDVTTRQADITTKHIEINLDHADIETRHDDIKTRHTNIITLSGETETNKNIAVQAKDEAVQAKNDAEQIRDSLAGSYVDAGTLDASSGTLPEQPSVSSMWHITVAGTLDGIQYGAGDVLAFTTSNDSFYKIDNTESVYSVNNQHGVVTLDYTHVSALPDTTTIHDLSGYSQTEIDTEIAELQADINLTSATLASYQTTNDAAVLKAQQTADAKVPEAPNDNQQYVRKNESWEQVSVDVNEAPVDGEQYVRKDAGWEQVSVDVNEAPQDGKLYFRKDGQWQAVEDTYLETTPVGITALWDGSAVPPAGWLECNGAEIFQNPHPELFALYKDKVQAGRAFLPDHRGEFLRGWDNGRGIDDGRTLGSNQGDAIAEFDITVDYCTPNSGGFYQRRVARGVESGGSPQSGTLSAIANASFVGANFSDETRPRNNAVMVIIKAVAGPNLLSQIAVPQRTVINASSGQQSFSHSYEIGRPLWVYMNGVKLIQGDDFTATDGSTISLTSPLVDDTDIELESFGKLVLNGMIGDAPGDNSIYGRINSQWQQIETVTSWLARLTYFQSNSNFTLGTLVATDLVLANAQSFSVHVQGKGYIESPPIHFMAEAYWLTDKFIHAKGSRYSGNIGEIFVISSEGKLKLWWARASYWQSFSVMVYDSQNKGHRLNRITNITDAVMPAGTNATIALPQV